MKKLIYENYKKSTILLLLLCLVKFTYSQNTPIFNWGKVVNNSGHSSITATTTDRFGNIYVAGMFSTSITVNGHTITNYSMGDGTSNYLIKYDANGNGLWAKKTPFYVTELHSKGDDLYTVGLYYSTIYQYQGIPLPLPNTSGGAYLIAKSDLDNNIEWIHTIDSRGGVGGAYSTEYISVFIGNDDKIHALGIFNSSVTFSNGTTLSTTGVNTFHAVIDPSGFIQTTKKLGVVNTVLTYFTMEYFTMDKQNNIYRYADNKLIKYNEQGDVLFTKDYIPTGGVSITGLTTDPWSNVFFCGLFTGSTLSFGGISRPSSGGSTDAIIVKIDNSNGNVFWIKNLGWSGSDSYQHIKTDDIGNVYALSERGYGGLYGDRPIVVKYDNDGNELWQKTFVAAGNGYQLGEYQSGTVYGSSMELGLNGGNIIIAGRFRSGIRFDDNNIINEHSNTGSFFWGFFAQFGICDTPVPTIHVADSNICMGENTLLTVNVIPDYNYLWSNGYTTTAIQVDEPGGYSVMAIQDAECYGKSQEIWITQTPLPDNGVTEQNNILTSAEVTQGTTYQWLDCTNGYTPVNGADQVSFIPLQNGSYAVKVISPEGCTDTSACFTINNLSINNIELNQLISIYPNPAKSEININGTVDIQSVRILDLQGKELIQTKGNKIVVSGLSSGVYLIEVSTPNGIGAKKFVKE